MIRARGFCALQRVDVLRREVGHEVDFPGLESGHLGDRVLDHADHDAIQIGQPRLEVLVEPIHGQMAPLHPFDEPEGPASHDRLGLAGPPVFHRVFLRGGGRVENQPRAIASEHVQHERVGVLEPDLHGGGIEHLDRVHRLVKGPHAGLGRGVHDAVDAELDGGGVDLGVVVEEDVLPELEGVEEAVGGHLPGLRGVGHELPIGRDVDEAAPDVHRDPHHFVAGRRVEIEVGDLVAVGDAQGPAALRRLGQGGVPGRGPEAGESDQSNQEASW